MRTVDDLTRALNDQLGRAARSDADLIQRVTNLQLYGVDLRRSRALVSLTLELSGSSPRIIATTSWSSRTAISIAVHMLTGDIVPVQCALQDDVEQVKRKLEESEGYPVDEQRLIFGEHQLEDGRSLLDYGIDFDSTLYMVLRLRGGGGGPVAFANVADDSLLVQQAFSTVAPEWRGCDKGLNIEGRCDTRSCKAFGKMVISRQRFTAFNLMGNCDNAQCPMCHKAIIPVTCGFYECVWKFEGVRESDPCHISSPWKPAFGNQYHRFDADETHGTIAWQDLLVVAKPRSVASARRSSRGDAHVRFAGPQCTRSAS